MCIIIPSAFFDVIFNPFFHETRSVNKISIYKKQNEIQTLDRILHVTKDF